MKKTISILSSALLATAVQAADESTYTAAIDTRDVAVRELENVSELQALAWSSSADWAAGGEAGVSVQITATPMSGSDVADPSGWSVAGSAVEILSTAGGEGTQVWAVSRQNLYRLELKIGEESVFAYFNLADAGGLAGPKAISEDGAITSATLELTATGAAVHPAVTVTNGGKTLVEGKDYRMEYANDVNVGTATATAVGLGEYKGTISLDYAILPAEDSEVAKSANYAGVAFDGRDDRVLSVRWLKQGRPVAWNTSESFPVRVHSLTNYHYGADGGIVTNTVDFSSWTAGGVADATVKSRISVAPLASADAEPGEFTVVREVSGEGSFTWYPKNGLWLLKLERVDSDENVTGTLTRILDISGTEAMILFVR